MPRFPQKKGGADLLRGVRSVPSSSVAHFRFATVRRCRGHGSAGFYCPLFVLKSASKTMKCAKTPVFSLPVKTGRLPRLQEACSNRKSRGAAFQSRTGSCPFAEDRSSVELCGMCCRSFPAVRIRYSLLACPLQVFALSPVTAWGVVYPSFVHQSSTDGASLVRTSGIEPDLRPHRPILRRSRKAPVCSRQSLPLFRLRGRIKASSYVFLWCRQPELNRL